MLNADYLVEMLTALIFNQLEQVYALWMYRPKVQFFIPSGRLRADMDRVTKLEVRAQLITTGRNNQKVKTKALWFIESSLNKWCNIKARWKVNWTLSPQIKENKQKMPSPSHIFQNNNGIFTALSLQGEHKTQKCQLRSQMTHNIFRRISHENLKGLHSLDIRWRFAFLYVPHPSAPGTNFQYLFDSQIVTVADPILLFWIAVFAQVTIIYPCDAWFCCFVPAKIMKIRVIDDK